MEYAIYPFEYMNISLRHDKKNHLPHWYPQANYSDKPWDEACKDSGKSYFVPQNDFRVVQILGIDPSPITNSVRLESVNKLKIPYQEEPVILELTLTHMDESNLRQLKEGQIIHKGEKKLMEGTDGKVTGPHFHITANIGKYYGVGQNSNGSSVFCYEKSLLPNEAFYIDKECTNIINPNGYDFKEVPKQVVQVGTPVERNSKVDQLKVKVPQLNARKEPSLNGEILGFIREGYYDIQDKTEADGYIWYKVQDMWIAYKEEWEDILIHEETKEEIQISYMNRILDNLPSKEKIKEYLEKLIEK